MRIIELHIKNLNSLRLTKTIHFLEAPLGNTGLFAIVGDTGSGKTTILDAITLALYGRVPRHDKNPSEVLSYGASEAFAQVIFEAGDKRYLAEWSVRRARGKVDGKIQTPSRKLSEYDPGKQEYIPIAENVKEVNYIVSERTGLDYDRFLRSVLLSQGEFAAFLQAKAQERSELLERITGLEIYSEISKAAFERHKIEDQKLQSITLQKESLQLLTSEEKKAFRKEEKALKSESKKRRAQSSELNTLLTQAQQVEKLKAQLVELDREDAALESERKDLKSTIQQLDQHRKVAPFSSELSRLEWEIDKKGDLESRLHQISEKEHPQVLSEEQIVESKLQTSQTLFSEKKEALPIQQKLFNEVLTLDAHLSSAAEKQDETEKTRQKEGEELQKLEESLHVLQKKRAEQVPQIREWEGWLQQYSYLQGLSADWAILKRTAEEWKEGGQRLTGLTQTLSQTQKQQKSEQRQLPNLTKKLDKTRKDIANTQEQLTGLRPDLFAHSQAELASLQNRELSAWKQKAERLERLEELQNSYQQLLEEQNHYQAELNNLKTRESHLLNDLLSTNDLLEELQEHLKFKQSIYEQQIRIANYQKDRQELQEGQECPLCFSTHHPFRDHAHEETFVDEAGEEYQSSKEKLEQVQKKQSTFIHQLNQLEIQMETLRGSESKGIMGLQKRQEQKLETQEQKMWALIDGFPEKEVLYAPDLRRKRQEWYTEQLKKEEETWLLISTHFAQLDVLKKTELELREQLQSLEYRISNLEKETEHLQHNLDDAKIRQEKQEQELSKLLTQYKYTFSKDKLDAHLLALQQLHQQFLQTQQQYIALEEVRKKEEAQETALSERHAEKQKAHQRVEVELGKMQANLKNLRAQRFDKLGDRDPLKEQDSLQNELDGLNEQLNALKEERAEMKSRLQALVAETKQLIKKLGTQETELAKLESSLSKKLKKAGFDSIAKARKMLLPKEDAEAMEANVARVQKWETELAHSRKTLSRQLKEERAKIPEELDISGLQLQLRDAQSQLEEHQQRLGKLEGILEGSKKNETEAKALEKGIFEQKTELARWKAINELIGSSDGKKFRAFAQGLTLERLVFLANQHLEQLNGRYRIRKTPGEELELEIMDIFQANNIRSMQTLSGGETFLVSLSLALGLSDLAGQRSDIRSLFIDEGFGTLDEATLDLAISTLENLQAKGKTIGIISHVKELKERIGTQIRVVKRSNGFSEVEVVG